MENKKTTDRYYYISQYYDYIAAELQVLLDEQIAEGKATDIQIYAAQSSLASIRREYSYYKELSQSAEG